MNSTLDNESIKTSFSSSGLLVRSPDRSLGGDDCSQNHPALLEAAPRCQEGEGSQGEIRRRRSLSFFPSRASLLIRSYSKFFFPLSNLFHKVARLIVFYPVQNFCLSSFVPTQRIFLYCSKQLLTRCINKAYYFYLTHSSCSFLV